MLSVLIALGITIWLIIGFLCGLAGWIYYFTLRYVAAGKFPNSTPQTVEVAQRFFDSGAGRKMLWGSVVLVVWWPVPVIRGLVKTLRKK